MTLDRIKKSAAAAALALAMLLGGCAKTNGGSDASGASGASDASGSAAQDDGSNDVTSIEMIRLMGNGINLGNTLEAYAHQNYLNGADPADAETAWGQPITTPEMIQGMKDAGFDTLRVPIAWTNGMNFESGDYTIDERLFARVEQVVNYALDADMYVIINDHWDGSWWGMFGSADETVRNKAFEMYKSMWTQIGERFADYSYKLIFEGANEELGDRLNDSDITGSKGILNKNECYEMTNRINSEFVKTIRALGGRNADRFLLIAGYNTDVTMTCDDRFVMPEDSAQRLLLSVHYYTPWDYCGTDSVNQWGSPQDVSEQNGLFEKLSKFSEQGYGVVIGEYAVMMKNGGIKPETDKFYKNLLDNCDLYDFCPVLWDCSSFYKRRSLKTTDEACAKLFDERRYANEQALTTEQVKQNARESLAAFEEAANAEYAADVDLPASDDMAIAWIMFQSADYKKSYSVGDTYDPTSKTLGIKAANAEITGEGSYSVSLDFTESGAAWGTAFSALGISNGETFFPGYTITIDEILINGEPYEPAAREYTASDDKKCTRVNLFNGWVSSLPDDARTPDGNLDGCSAQIMPLDNNVKIETLTINFTYSAPQG